MSRKRKHSLSPTLDPESEEPQPAPIFAKKPKISISAILGLSSAELRSLSKEELISHIITLQSCVKKSPGATQEWTAEKVAERAEKLRSICANEIKKQMKWQPSCKKGNTKWSYTGVVPTQQVFYKLFGFPMDSKPWKQRKIPRAEFVRAVGHIGASVRYNDLRITSEQINIKWSQEENTFTLSGTYGI